MSGRVMAEIDLVAALADHFSVQDDNAADRVLAWGEVAFSGKFDRPPHPLLVFFSPCHDRTSCTGSGVSSGVFNPANRDVNRRRV
jgi:hypothetical protein